MGLFLVTFSSFYLLLYNFKLAINPNIEHKLYEMLIDQSSTRKLPNNGSSTISARVHKICAMNKKINPIKNNNPILFIVQTYEKYTHSIDWILFKNYFFILSCFMELGHL